MKVKVIGMMLLFMQFNFLGAQEKKHFLSVEVGTLISPNDLPVTSKLHWERSEFKTRSLPGFYGNVFFNQELSQRFTLREGIGLSWSRGLYESRVFDGDKGKERYNLGTVNFGVINFPVHLMWSSKLITLYSGLAYSINFYSPDYEHGYNDSEYYDASYIDDMKFYNLSFDIGGNIRVRDRVYLTLGYSTVIGTPFGKPISYHVVQSYDSAYKIGVNFELK
ncbi:hypothetical protein K5X82_13065 [Halosquirtibacter xylanolyticus]|uniref:hypothetical protein n=1 Tax=Halosquirtibacter xylanolyticus TaxID=3374599 RepID=UPI00374A20C9|nr:hypothetical protein K5X82_13065 [Prolixibacteraceae bacterium]